MSMQILGPCLPWSINNYLAPAPQGIPAKSSAVLRPWGVCTATYIYKHTHTQSCLPIAAGTHHTHIHRHTLLHDTHIHSYTHIAADTHTHTPTLTLQTHKQRHTAHTHTHSCMHIAADTVHGLLSPSASDQFQISILNG